MKHLLILIVVILVGFISKEANAQNKSKLYKMEPEKIGENQISLYNTTQSDLKYSLFFSQQWNSYIIESYTQVTLESKHPVQIRIKTDGTIVDHTIQPKHYYLFKVNTNGVYDLYEKNK